MYAVIISTNNKYIERELLRGKVDSCCGLKNNVKTDASLKPISISPTPTYCTIKIRKKHKTRKYVGMKSFFEYYTKNYAENMYYFKYHNLSYRYPAIFISGGM